jgi:hypothetical protein
MRRETEIRDDKKEETGNCETGVNRRGAEKSDQTLGVTYR